MSSSEQDLSCTLLIRFIGVLLVIFALIVLSIGIIIGRLM